MFNRLLIAILVKAIETAMCQLFEICKGQRDCPDGVCDDVLAELKPTETDTVAEIAADEGLVSSFAPDWSKLEPLAKAAIAFIVALRDFLQLGPRVG